MGILLVYDVTDQKSFDGNSSLSAPSPISPGVNKILIGNKCDMNDKRVSLSLTLCPLW